MVFPLKIGPLGPKDLIWQVVCRISANLLLVVKRPSLNNVFREISLSLAIALHSCLMPESLTTDELNQDQVSVTTQCSSPDMELSECANVHLVQDAGSNANPRIFCQSFVFVLYSSSSWHKREEDDCWACLTILSIILWPNQLQYFVFYIWEAQAFDASEVSANLMPEELWRK